MSDIPTVKIKHDEGYAIINESDFDPSVHEKFEASPGPADVPEGWPDLHWKTRVGIARKIVGGDEEITSEKANEIIAAEVERRTAEKASA